jgi:hypothetical protein
MRNQELVTSVVVGTPASTLKEVEVDATILQKQVDLFWGISSENLWIAIQRSMAWRILISQSCQSLNSVVEAAPRVTTEYPARR